MIPYDSITAWGATHPWSTREQVEQDLLLSQALCEIMLMPQEGSHGVNPPAIGRSPLHAS